MKKKIGEKYGSLRAHEVLSGGQNTCWQESQDRERRADRTSEVMAGALQVSGDVDSWEKQST